ncbi:hypothetical protein [Selenomonas ruminantium]|uniref:Uncharacterized protein n=1 Tax=Selenomonas ruminantium TaxID=971 RepID=A0A1H0P3L4_SELRU|nr:hypothetical protein [Selenomonas ruminantium]SDO99667.1 hypothetical protein SAMN05216366_10499 [Selenomonas ruminantium]
MYKSTEDALMEALKNERARNQTMEIINQIRAMGGVPVILRLAGAILSVPPAKTETA